MRFSTYQTKHSTFFSLIENGLEEFMREKIKSDFQVVKKHHDILQFSQETKEPT